MQKAFPIFFFVIMVVIFLTTTTGKVVALPEIDNPSDNNSMILSWRAHSNAFNKLHDQLNEDFSRYGKSKKMLKNIFYRSHQLIFLRYELYSMTQDTFESGVFDCVSGSLILAGLLDYYGFDFKIVETTHHVFLEVEISDEVVLFEVTDPLDGFIIDNESKKNHFESFKSEKGSFNQTNFQVISSEGEPVNIYRNVGIQELIGLQYFNQAIKYYNDKNRLLAYQFVRSALKMYGAPRIKAFSEFLKEELALIANK